MKSKIILAVAIFSVLGLSLLYLPKFTKKSSPNIFVLLIDTLRADHLGTYGYSRDTSPNIDKLAKDSIVFHRALAAASWTAPSVSTILSGLYPSQHTNQPVRERGRALKLGSKLPNSIETMSERLKTRGYRTAGISTNPWITAEFNIDQGFDNFHYFDRAAAEKVVKSAKKIVGSYKETEPSFLYMHFMDPHSPYAPQKSFANLFSGSNGKHPYGEVEQKKINLYDAEIKYTDHHIGTFIDFLKEKNLYDDAVIILLADHGEAFLEHGTSGHGYQLFMEEVHIPLLVKVPGHKGSILKSVSQIDVLPTILDVVGADPDVSLPGVSLLDSEAIEKRTGVLSEVYRVYEQHAYTTTEGERLIKDFGNRKSPFLTQSQGLFNLNQDPSEQKLIESPEITAELDGYLQGVNQNNQKNISKVDSNEVTISDSTFKKLESLGYIND